MREVIYDTGALLAAERRDVRMWGLHNDLLAQGLAPSVPVPVLAQAWRGGPQVELSRLLKGCHKEHMDEGTARSAGRVCAAANTSDIVDAVVVVTAAGRDALVVTSDTGDLSKLADAIDVPLRLRAI